MHYRDEGEDSSFGFTPINYYEALYGAVEVRITLADGRLLALRRQGLGRFFLLQWLDRAFTRAPQERRVDILRDWLEAAQLRVGTAELDLDELALEDLIAVTAAVRALNRSKGETAWRALGVRMDDGAVRTIDYMGRELAYIVHLLASRYGWSHEHILALPPEVALSHVQECLLALHKEREWTYFLSDRAWEYDKNAKVSRYRPLPELEWATTGLSRRTYSPIPDAIREKYFPGGVVIDLTRPNERIGRDSSNGADHKAPE